jgi:hypothetical protein
MLPEDVEKRLSKHGRKIKLILRDKVEKNHKLEADYLQMDRYQ